MWMSDLENAINQSEYVEALKYFRVIFLFTILSNFQH